MFDPEHAISPDLKWMLQSGQATPDLLLESMASEYYQPVYRLAMGLLERAELAGRATRETFVRAAMHASSFRTESSVRAWMFRHAIISCKNLTPTRRSDAQKQKNPELVAGADSQQVEPEGAIRQSIKTLPLQQKQILMLHALTGLSADEIANVLKLSESTVQDQLKAALERLASDSQIAGEMATAPADDILLERLRACFPAEDISANELAEVTAWAVDQVHARSLRRRVAIHARELVLVSLSIVLAIIIFWAAGSRLSGGEPDQTAVPSGPTPSPRQSAIYLTRPGDTPETIASLAGSSAEAVAQIGRLEQPGQIVSVPLEVFTDTMPASSSLADLPEMKALSPRSDSEAIRQRLMESPGLWHTLWMQAEELDYGPAGYIGPPVGSRYQAWVSQPDHSLELVGPYSGQIEQISLVTGGRQFRAQGRSGQLYLEPRSEGDYLLQDDILRLMIFPRAAPWMQPGGVFEAIETDRVAGRRTLAVDWRNPLGEREYRLWLDVATGVVLRLQRFGGGDGQTLLVDVLVTQARFDRVIPAEIYDPRTAGLQGFAQDELGTPLRFALAPSLVPQARQPLAYNSPPANLYVGRSPLVFQFPLSLGETALVSGTQTIDADLFAGGFFLGKVSFNLPWSIVCTRSPDGQRLAYAVLANGQMPGTFAWLNLAEPEKIYGAGPDFQAQQLAFAPDNQRLALFGHNGNQPSSGISILNLGTGTLEHILEIADAHSLVWSPDGNYLAFLGKVEARISESDMFVVNLNTHQVVYRQPYLPGAGLPADSPLASWGVVFPLPEELYPCAAPPS